MPSFTSAATAGLALSFGLTALLAIPEPINAHSLHEQRSALGATRRRHHARLAQSKRHDNVSSSSHDQHDKRGDFSTLVTGLGMGTLYFDVDGGGTCGPVNVRILSLRLTPYSANLVSRNRAGPRTPRLADTPCASPTQGIRL